MTLGGSVSAVQGEISESHPPQSWKTGKGVSCVFDRANPVSSGRSATKSLYSEPFGVDYAEVFQEMPYRCQYLPEQKPWQLFHVD